MSQRIRMSFIALGAAFAISACASSAPSQLVAARDSYRLASEGPALGTAPAELRTAEQALDRAERSFRNDGASADTIDLAYIAQRRSEIATAIAHRKIAEANKERYEAQRVEVSDQLRVDAVGELKTTKQDLGREEDRSARERAARLEAEKETDAANAETDKAKADAAAAKVTIDGMRAALARWAQLAENERGLVITLSSGVLFASGRSEILPAAGARLGEIANLLRASPGRNVLVEGHTDSAGNDGSNQVLSQARADAVRSFLVMQGVPAERVSALGYGESRPIATNAAIEGRATNRRVEIVLTRMPVPPAR